jgi:Spy/CpxP family protein refolding chaperone
MANRYFFKTTLSAVALLLSLGAAHAQPVGPMHMDPARIDKMIEQHVARMSKAVNATPEQQAKLLAIAKAAQADIKPLHEQIAKRMEQAKQEGSAVLTPEQRAQWEAQMKSHMGRMREGMRERMEKPN